MNLYHSFLAYILFHTWRDLVEILLFASSFYYLMLWLKRDRDKPLLAYFYGYCAFVFIAYLLQLSTIAFCLFIFSPALIMLFMVMHQETLQRNMIALKNIQTPTLVVHDWLSSIMKNSLKAMHARTSMLLLIEHTDALADFVKAEYRLHGNITDDMLTMLMEQGLCDAYQMLWIRTDGTIQGVHATFKATWHPTRYQDPHEWIDDAIVYTSKTDAIIVHSDAQTKRYAIALRGTITSDLTAEQASQLIKKQLHQPPSSEKGFSHDRSSHRTTESHPTP